MTFIEGALIYKRLKLIYNYYLSLILMLENCLLFLFNGYAFRFISTQDESEHAFKQENSILLLICCKAITETILWSPLTGPTKNCFVSNTPSFYKRKHDKER